MHKLGEGEATMTKDEYTKMKQELEAWVQLKQNTVHFAEHFSQLLPKLREVLSYCFMCCFLFSEYLAVFKKTVQVHEVFLQRLSSHPILSKDRNFQIFLEYEQDVSST